LGTGIFYIIDDCRIDVIYFVDHHGTDLGLSGTLKITTPTPSKKDKGGEGYFGAARYLKNEKVANVVSALWRVWDT
jgi:hypothetical protein